MLFLSRIKVNNESIRKIIDERYKECLENETYIINVSDLDTSQVTDMSELFYEYPFEKIEGIETWDTSQVKDMSGMFLGCNNLKKININGFDTRQVTNMRCMFADTSIEEIQGIENLNTSKVENMYGMFSYCPSLKKLNLSKWDTSEVTNMEEMFCCSYLEILNLSKFNTSKVINMSKMFYDVSQSIKIINISSFDFTNVKYIDEMFTYEKFNRFSNVEGDIGKLEQIKGIEKILTSEAYKNLSKEEQKAVFRYTKIDLEKELKKINKKEKDR